MKLGSSIVRRRAGSRGVFCRCAAMAAAGALLTAGRAAAQGMEGMSMPDSAKRIAWSVGAQAVGLVTRVSPAFGGRAYTEGYLTQPAVMAHASALGGHVVGTGTLNLEGWTLRRGELDPGIYGEGYVDRRHPHTYVHEAVLSAVDALGRADGAGVLSLSAGKGFVPFGTDDPMSRPFVKYPVNHHLAQILERVVASAGYRRGPVLLEASVFGGDEPIGPGAPPVWRRFGDSRAGRVTVSLPGGLEAQASRAFVASPEFATGAGPDQRKWSASLRMARAGRYALVEWARSDEYNGSRRSFRFQSVLGEGSLDRGPWRLALRGERTVRPEEERLEDPFRAPRPHADANLVGTTRWTLATAGVSRAWTAGALRLRPFAEATHAWAVAQARPAVFIPADFYGSSRIWSLSAGVRVGAGMVHPRMGRYGAADAQAGGESAGAAAHEGHGGHDESHHPNR
ncbi:MAG: hypothetical protein JWM27_3759 [Gemmatimonadetes bacterium]|nr:hypothetical protein [Gemmatimonadota bacterium]